MENLAILELRNLMKKHSLNQPQLASRIFIPQNRLCEILKQRRRFSVETDIKLCKLFKLKKAHFLILQQQYEINLAEIKYKSTLDKIVCV